MTITFKSESKPIDAAEMAELESGLQTTLPDDYKSFLAAYNVAIPDKNVYRVAQFLTSVDYFFGISADKMHDLLARNTIAYANRLPVGVIAIAHASGGNLICLRLGENAIYHWDHEGEAMDDQSPCFDNMTKLASSFGEFLSGLRPPQPEDFPSIGAKVISVKLKPGFHEKFGKNLIR